ncbi:hypothetical protein JYU34_000198 [Plutella xylostella]|uniref:Uncharacterized protein n=1 Tax=Plutella xylostella TaxID=51655 RepID=A0ABQ7R737_PLUXY|nr:hypothetical protein JYU34_000198 [Plutella xylostella]
MAKHSGVHFILVGAMKQQGGVVSIGEYSTFYQTHFGQVVYTGLLVSRPDPFRR